MNWIKSNISPALSYQIETIKDITCTWAKVINLSATLAYYCLNKYNIDSTQLQDIFQPQTTWAMLITPTVAAIQEEWITEDKEGAETDLDQITEMKKGKEKDLPEDLQRDHSRML